ncbi:DedA family protein [Pseudogracilibacillus sp. SE30717A]|uniref:DedA family protein n=1 Tax=Pseudogracilibacillus sp. SE30717A TaxID=3098293 RepID=UPI00300E234F
MQDWVIEMLEKFGYAGVLLMMALENVFPPVPSEVILLFSGFMTTYTNLSVFGVIITATTGSILGAIILYGMGRLIHVERLEIIIERWQSIIRLKKQDLHMAKAWFDKHGYAAVFFCRMVPIVRSLISIPAGMSGMTFWLFLLLTMIGTIIWNALLVIVGTVLGASWIDILGFLEVYSKFAYVLIATGLVFLIFLYIHKRRKQI